MIDLSIHKLRILCVPAIATGICSCTPEATNSIDGDSLVQDARPIQQVFVSNKRVTSDCGLEYVPAAVPGFAESLGREIKQTPPPIAANLAVGAGRELVATDEDRVSPGYVLVEPYAVKQSFLINNDKEVVATLENDYYTTYTQLLPNGHRLIEAQTYSRVFDDGGGENGCVEEQDEEGNVLWRVSMNSDLYVQHHDVIKLENGNFLALVWEMSSAEEAIAQGRDPEVIPEDGNFWYDGIIEVNPYTMQIVWEWSIKHHMVQEFDAGKPNYGVVADNPDLLDLNKFTIDLGQTQVSADWTHLNAIDYNPELDQIAMSSYQLSEVWVIDHSTTPLDSAGHSGGRYGKGGDFLYRWGNPANYNRGSEADRELFHQHDVQWILPGLPGEGNLLIFNNGDVPRQYTTVVEITPDMNANGSYNLSDDAPYGPEDLAWEYNPTDEERFFSFFISGAQRLANGNTLVNQGAGGHMREVTPSGDIVWDYSYKNEVDAPHMIFRAYRYPENHPGLAQLLPSAE